MLPSAIVYSIGLHKRIFNTQAICLVDLNGDGILDMVFNNEGQEGVALIGFYAFGLNEYFQWDQIRANLAAREIDTEAA